MSVYDQIKNQFTEIIGRIKIEDLKHLKIELNKEIKFLDLKLKQFDKQEQMSSNEIIEFEQDILWEKEDLESLLQDVENLIFMIE